MQPLVSVIIPAFNSKETILRAVDSVLQQTYRHIEIIVVDDGSTDETPDLLSELAQTGKIRYFFQSNQGQGAARNYGVSKAQSDWIAFLDADDEWYKEKLEIQVNYINAHHDAGLIFSNADYFEGNKKTGSLFPDFCHRPNLEKYIYAQLLSGNFIPTSSVVMKKHIFIKLGEFNERSDFRNVEDYDLWLRFVRAGFSLNWVDKCLVKYQMPDNTKKNDNRIARGLQSIYKRELFFSPLRSKLLAWKHYRRVSKLKAV